MNKPGHHVFVCGSFRAGGDVKGACQKKNSASLLQYLESELGDRGMDDVMVTGAGCMSRCEKGPLMVVYPEGHWYGEINEQKVDMILDALEKGEAAEALLLS
jgi:(2Fe-2S) ferredoxin